jgi:hypothetical protein
LALALLLRGIGRRARVMRAKAKRSTDKIADSEIQARQGPGGAWRDWHLIEWTEEADEAISAWEREPVTKVLADVDDDRSIRVGMAVAAAGMVASSTAPVWRQEDAAEAYGLRKIQHRFRHDISRFKRELAAKKKGASAAAIARALADGAKEGGRKGRKSRGTRTKDASAGGGNKGGGAGGATPVRNAGTASKNEQRKAFLAATQASKRTDDDCKKWMLCHNCRAYGHTKAQCSAAKVDYVP